VPGAYLFYNHSEQNACNHGTNYRLKTLKELAERRAAAAAAKKLLLKKFETAPKPSDPDMVAKRAEREAVAAARETRRVERERSVQEERDRQIVEAAAVARAASAQADALEAEATNRIARVATDTAERKAERDRRYAARKAKQR
jgi:Family of unknown function (DUF6481)